MLRFLRVLFGFKLKEVVWEDYMGDWKEPCPYNLKPNYLQGYDILSNQNNNVINPGRQWVSGGCVSREDPGETS